MTGRPDYDAGDLVVLVVDSQSGLGRKGQVYTAAQIVPPDVFDSRWGVHLKEVGSIAIGGWLADSFRRIDPKPAEYFAGTTSADAGERVTA